MQIDDHRVDVAQHRGRRRAPLTIEAMDRQAGEGIALEADVRVVLGRAPEPVFGRPQGRERHRPQVGEQRGGVEEPCVNRRLMRDQRDPAAAQERRALADEHIETGTDVGHPEDDRRVSVRD